MSEELKPCPFCGHSPHIEKDEHIGLSKVVCGKCWVEMPSILSDDMLIKKWNTRRVDGMLNWLDAEMVKTEQGQIQNVGWYHRFRALFDAKRQLTKLVNGLGVNK